jgi:multiple sugar transport system substrate-binding protein
VTTSCVDLEASLRRTLVLVVALVFASACTGASSNDEPTVLRIALADDWASAPAVIDVIDEFEEDHPNVRVEVQASPFSQIPDLVRSGLELDQSYDLAHWHAFAAAAAGLAHPVDEQWERHGLRAETYLDGAVQSVTWLGRRYGVPLDTNALVLMVRPEVLAEAGVTPDDLADVDDVLDVAHRLVEGEAAPHAMLVGASSWAAYGWIRAFGGRLVTIDEATGEPTFTFDDERTVAALDLRARLVHEGLAPSPFAPDIAAEGVQLFAQGQLAVHSGGSWDLPLLAREDVDPEEVEVLPLPRGDGDTGTVLGGSSLFVPVDAQHPDLAFEFALRLTEDRVALRLAREEGRLPARAHLFEDEFFTSSPDIEAFVRELPDADVMPLIAFPEVSEAFREGIENTLAGRQDAEAAMGEVQRFAESWLEQQ